MLKSVGIITAVNPHIGYEDLVLHVKRLKQENLLGVMFRAWCTDRRELDIILIHSK